MKLNPISKDVKEAVDAYFAKNPEALSDYRMTAIGSLQPTAGTIIPGGVGWIQGAFMGDFLAPDVIGGRDQRLVWIEYGDDALVVGDDLVAPDGPVLPVDAGMTLHAEETQTHGRSASIDAGQARMAAAVGLNLVEVKSAMPQRLVELGKEKATADFFLDTGNYAGSTQYQSLSGTDLFTDSSSNPIAKLRQLAVIVRGLCGTRPNRIGFGYEAMEALSWNESILNLLKLANTLGNGIPVTAQVVALLLNMDVAVGEAVYRTRKGGPSASVWGDNAFMVYVGGKGLADPKFAMTAVSPDFPKVIPMVSQKGLEGGQEIRYGDCYKTFSCWKTAGAALFDCTGA
jgi:hypothetical protein